MNTSLTSDSKSTEGAAIDKPPNRKVKVIRRDPAKRRMQNRQAQKVYREKQRQRIQELERLAGVSQEQIPTTASPPSEQQVITSPPRTEVALPSTDTDAQVVNLSQLQIGSTTTSNRQNEDIWDNDLLSTTFDQWLTDNQLSLHSNDVAVPTTVFFNCGCPVLHIPMRPSPVLLPVIPDVYMNTLRLETWCVVGAMLENCLHVGITQAMFCSDNAISPFFRLQSAESSGLVASVQRVFKSLQYDLRPTLAQITTEHHPYIDAIPFQDIRDNLIEQMDVIDEDEFFHDALNHLRCWGGVAGAHTGSPWDSRSWEASEMFLRKWSHIVGGDDGELTRQSRWWRSLRGDRITEVF
ncbi:Fc.00g111740.m01.CDS01 [Cosmosporella sp. VM-42]